MQQNNATSSAFLIEGSRDYCSASPPVLLQLLDLGIDKNSDLLLKLVRAATRQRQVFCKSMAAAVVPVYVTSICNEDCQYCNFRRSNRSQHIERRQLSTVELEGELTNLICERGYRAVELVYANDPKLSPSDIATHVAICRRVLDTVGGGVIGVNVHPMSTDGYKRLVDAGLDFAVQWQETYNRNCYAAYHAAEGNKRDYDYRYNAYERMLWAGIHHIGVGILFGLAPWREDFKALLRHETELYRRFGIWPAILGTARLKPARGAMIKHTEFVPNDEELVCAIAVHTLFAPHIVPWVSTRESWDLCVKLAQGGCLFTFDCSTTPGGYSHETKSYQFPTHDFPASVYSKEIERHGLKTVFDWAFGHRGGLESSSSRTEAAR